MTTKREALYAVSTGIWLITVIALTIFKPLQGNLLTFTLVAVTVLYAVFLLLIKQRGALPPQLIRDYTPLPLALISPPNKKLRARLQTYILPALEAAIKLVDENTPGKAYDIIKRVKEFFEEELGGAENLDKIANKIRQAQIYAHIENKDERTDAEYSLASLIHWIRWYRNLAFHSPRVNADPIDAWFALRTTLIYIQDRYPIREATLYTKCPQCNAINTVKLTERNAKWLTRINVTCSKCRKNYNVELTPNTIQRHHNLAKQAAKQST